MKREERELSSQSTCAEGVRQNPLFLIILTCLCVFAFNILDAVVLRSVNKRAREIIHETNLVTWHISAHNNFEMFEFRSRLKKFALITISVRQQMVLPCLAYH